MTLEVKSVASLLGTPVSYAYAVKAGPWLFLTGHEAFDWRSGAIDEAVAGPPSYPLFGTRHRSRREADFIFNRMRGVLREFGTDFAHAIRLDQYYPNPRAVAAYHLARHDAFADYIPPSTSVVMDRVFGGRSTISTSLIAVVPRGRIRNPENPPAGCRLGADIGLCPGRGLQRVRLRRRADGAQPRHRSRPARDRSGACRLGRHTDPQADRVPDPRKAEAGARSGGLVAGAVGQGADLSGRHRRHAGLPRRLEPALRRHTVRGHGGADPILRDDRAGSSRST